MFLSHIRKSAKQNRLDLSSYRGKRVYYNKTRNYISLIIKIIVTIGFFVSCISLRGTSKNEAELGYVFLTLFGCFLVLDSIFESIGRLQLKNPVFILKDENLFYIHTNKSYDIRNYHFIDERVGKYNFYETFCMLNKNKERIIAEKNWHLADEENFKSQLKYNRRMLSMEVNPTTGST